MYVLVICELYANIQLDFDKYNLQFTTIQKNYTII